MTKIRKDVKYLCCGVILAMLTMSISPTAGAANPDPKKELAQVRSELEAYKKTALNTPEVISLNKEIQGLEELARAKEKELKELIDTKLNKDPKYIELTARVKESGEVNAMIAKYRTEAANDPEAQQLKKEASELRTKAQALESKTKELIEAKFNSYKEVKALIAKRDSLKSASDEATKYKNKIMSDQQIQGLQNTLKTTRDTLPAKRNQLKKITDHILKTDKKISEMDEKIKELTYSATGKKPPEKVAPSAAPLAQKSAPAGKEQGDVMGDGSPGPMDTKGGQGMGQEGGGKMMQPIERNEPAAQEKSKPEGLMEKLAGAKSEMELNNLISQYDKRKKELEETGKKIDSALKTLPPQSKLSQKIKDSLAKIGLPNINPELFK